MFRIGYFFNTPSENLIGNAFIPADTFWKIYFVGMGCCFHRQKEKEIVHSARVLFRPEKFQETNFFFTTENLHKVEADCLMLFCNLKMNLYKNSFMRQLSKLEVKKLTNFAQSYRIRSRIKVAPGQVLLFPISIPTLRFKYVCIGFLKIWDGRSKIRVKLEHLVASMFSWLEQSDIQTVALTEFNEEFGIPMEMGCQVFVDEIQKGKDWLKTVSLVCNDSMSQLYLMQKISLLKKELLSVFKEDISQTSNYF